MGRPRKGESVADRFWEFCIKLPNGCWEWTAARLKSKADYGILLSHGKGLRAHRVAWEKTFGPIPEGMQVLHRCDNPPCINPEHLFLGTHIDNMTDMRVKGRCHRGTKHIDSILTEHDVRNI